MVLSPAQRERERGGGERERGRESKETECGRERGWSSHTGYDAGVVLQVLSGWSQVQCFRKVGRLRMAGWLQTK